VIGTRTRGCFVTGTDTGVGKTRVAGALCVALGRRGLRVAAMKPVAAGCVRTAAGLRSDDALALAADMNVAAAYADVNPFAFEPPIAPHLAAAAAGLPIRFEVLDAAYARLSALADVVVVEGAGGWLVPLDARRSFADLAVHWRLDVVLVVGLRLGCLNHALLTAEAVQRRGLNLRGWVANTIDPGFEPAAANVDTLQRRLAVPCLGSLPYAPAASTAQSAERLDASLLGPL
jgi:dethiobiotin synthetase